jgi:hypothetical protein
MRQHRHLAALMSIPQPFDHDLAGIEDAAGSVLVQLRVMRHAAPGDVPKLRTVLRERLQTYVDQVMALADESAAR